MVPWHPISLLPLQVSWWDKQTSMISQASIQFEHVSIYRGHCCIVRDFNRTVQRGTRVAITGPNGAGKTSLLRAIAGKLPVTQGHIRYFLNGSHEATDTLKPYQLGWVDFHGADLVLHHPDAFYQQRYYASQTHGWVKVSDLLQEYAQQYLGIREDACNERLNLLCNHWHLFPSYLLERQVQQLSNGELKKLLILRALLSKPEILLLNAPFIGLDAASRKQLREMLQHIQAQGITVVMEVLPGETDDTFDDVIALQGRQHDCSGRNTVFQTFSPSWQPPEGTPLFEMRDVQVQYGRQQILKHIHWQVNTGERWFICGQNGSGKSTLLSLITTDHPQAYAQQVYWMGKRRGSGETIWDIKRHQAYVSPEMHYYLRTRQNCLTWLADQVKSHVSDSSLNSSIQQEALCYLQYWGLESYADQPVTQLSTGEQRLLLFIRALLIRAPLLILDEPCQGLDGMHRQQIRQMLESLSADPAFTLLYVTHDLQELPGCITHMLYLHKGEITYSGRYDPQLAERLFASQVIA